MKRNIFIIIALFITFFTGRYSHHFFSGEEKSTQDTIQKTEPSKRLTTITQHDSVEKLNNGKKDYSVKTDSNKVETISQQEISKRLAQEKSNRNKEKLMNYIDFQMSTEMFDVEDFSRSLNLLSTFSNEASINKSFSMGNELNQIPELQSYPYQHACGKDICGLFIENVSKEKLDHIHHLITSHVNYGGSFITFDPLDSSDPSSLYAIKFIMSQNPPSGPDLEFERELREFGAFENSDNS